MAEQDLQQPQATSDETVGAGVRLRHAREALRLSRADVAARTKIAERHLAAIEEERFSDLASSTYAVGFSRAYARAVGLDEREIAQAVRNELDMVDEAHAPPKPTFEPGDPARVPSSRVAWLAGGGALAVLALVGVFWGSYIFPAASLPDLTSDAAPVVPAPPAPAAAIAENEGPVVLTATQPGIWIKVTDETGRQLFQKELAQGESYTVPADAAGPLLRTARPEALSVAVGGRQIAALAERSSTITVPLSVSALLARGATPQPTEQSRAAQLPPVPVRAGQNQTGQSQTGQVAVDRTSLTSAPAARPSPTPRPTVAATASPRPREAAETPTTPSAVTAPTPPPPAASAEAAATANTSVAAADESEASPVSP